MVLKEQLLPKQFYIPQKKLWQCDAGAQVRPQVASNFLAIQYPNTKYKLSTCYLNPFAENLSLSFSFKILDCGT